MELVSLYETVIAERDHGYSVHVLMVPARCLPNWEPGEDLLEDLRRAAGLLGGEVYRTVGHASALPGLIAAVVRHEEDAAAANDALWDDPDVDDPLHRFAERVAFSRLVAAEASPLGAESVAGLLTKSTTGGGGVLIALQAVGATPMLLIAVPVGIVLIGASLGVAEALQTGLRSRILRRMGVEQDTEDERDPAVT